MPELGQIYQTVEEICDEYRKLRDHEAFVAWFCEAYLVGDRARAAEALTGTPGDLGIDAVYVDHRLGQVHLVQGKYHTSPHAQDNAAVREFAELSELFADPDAQDHWQRASAPAKKKILAAYKAYQTGDYYLAMYFVTTGTVKRDVAEDARKVALHTADSFEVFDHTAVLKIYNDWLEAAAPPLPELEIAAAEKTPLEHGGDSSPVAWLFTTTAAELARLYELAGDRLFSRNIRGYLGDSAINAEIRKTAKRESTLFWYLNNGLTIVATEANFDASSGRFRMKNPQIVNGQQTTRILSAAPDSQAQVLVRLITLPEGEDTSVGLRGLTGRIVRATNRQNAISLADLMANDPEQVRIQREFAKRHYFYRRKRESKAETGAKAGAHFRKVKRRDLANVMAVTELGLHMVGRDEVWQERYYEQLFSRSRDPSDYLARWWLFRLAQRIAREQTTAARHDSLWAVIWLLWNEGRLGKVLAQRNMRKSFIHAIEYGADEILKPLHIAMRRLFVLCGNVYQQERRSAEKQAKAEGYERSFVSPRTFFRRREAEKLLQRAIRRDKKRRTAVRNYVKNLARALKEYRNQGQLNR